MVLHLPLESLIHFYINFYVECNVPTFFFFFACGYLVVLAPLLKRLLLLHGIDFAMGSYYAIFGNLHFFTYAYS